MSFQIKYTNIDSTKAIEKYVQQKVGVLKKMARRDSDIQDIRVEIGKTSNHHKHGPHFFTKVEATVQGRLFVAEEKSENLYASVDAVREEILREVRKDKEKRTTLRRKFARAFKSKIRRMK